MIEDLDAIDRIILSLLYFRHIGGNNGISWDKNTTFARVVGTSESTISRRLDNGPGSLVTRGYVTSKIQRRRKGKRQPTKGERPEYETKRELRLTIKTIRLINSFKMAKDGL